MFCHPISKCASCVKSPKTIYCKERTRTHVLLYIQYVKERRQPKTDFISRARNLPRRPYRPSCISSVGKQQLEPPPQLISYQYAVDKINTTLVSLVLSPIAGSLRRRTDFVDQPRPHVHVHVARGGDTGRSVGKAYLGVWCAVTAGAFWSSKKPREK